MKKKIFALFLVLTLILTLISGIPMALASITASDWTLDTGWTSSVDSNNNLVLNNDATETGKASYKPTLDGTKGFVFSYDMTFDSNDYASTALWIDGYSGSQGNGQYFFRFKAINQQVLVEGQFNDAGQWINDVMDSDYAGGWIGGTGNKFTVIFEKKADDSALYLTVKATESGTVLYAATLTYAGDKQMDDSALHFIWGRDADGSTPYQLSNINVVVSEEIPDSVNDWTLSDSWRASADSNSNLVLKNDATGTGQAAYNPALDGTKGFILSYDMTIDSNDYASTALWIDGYTGSQGNGTYFFRIKTINQQVLVEGQFNEAGQWVNDVMNSDYAGGWIGGTGNKFTVIFEKKADDSALYLTVKATESGTVLYAATLTYAEDKQMDDSALHFIWGRDADGSTPYRLSNINAISEPVTPQTDATSWELGNSWVSSTDTNGYLVLSNDATTPVGRASYVPKIDGTQGYTISYDMTVGNNSEPTSTALWLNGYSGSQGGGNYLFRIKTDSQQVRVEGQFDDNGTWVDNVLSGSNTAQWIAGAGDKINVCLKQEAGGTEITLTVRAVSSGAVLYTGTLTYAADQQMNETGLQFVMGRDEGSVTYTLSNICMKTSSYVKPAVGLENLTVTGNQAALVGASNLYCADLDPFDADIESVVWKLTEGSGDPVQVGSYKALYYSFDKAGEYTLTCTATNSNGNEKTNSITVTVTAPETEETEQLLGDVNGDSLINSMDARLVLQYLANNIDLTNDQIKRACVTGSSIPGEADIQAILDKAATSECAAQAQSKGVVAYAGYLADLTTFPVSFTYDGVAYNGFGKDFTEQSRTVVAEDSKTSIKVVLLHASGLQVTLDTAVYPAYDAYEWTVYFTNTSDKNSAQLSDINGADVYFAGSDPVLKGITGDYEGKYSPYSIDLTERKSITKRSISGWPSHDSFPYFNLEYGDGGTMLAVGWSGTWKATFEATETGTHFTGSQYKFDAYLKPGEVIRTPLMAFVQYEGRDENTATNAWRRWYIDCNTPKQEDGSSVEPFSTLYTGKTMDGASSETQWINF